MTTLTDIKKKEDIIKPKLDISTDSRMLTYDKAVPDNELTGNVYYSTDNGNTFVVGNTVPQNLSNSIPPTIQREQVNFVKQLDYASDNMNPLLQQTITRVISIDSQYRSDKTSLPTDFTFDLSDPLKDVVSLSLYSVQIPNTWYTIAKSYGSNFFYIKGNSPGINNGNHNIQIEIAPGNYSPTDFVTQLNTVSFSSTNGWSFPSSPVSYNSNNGKITLTGSKCEHDGYYASCVLLEEMKKDISIFPDLDENAVNALKIANYKITMINSDFNTNFRIDLLKLLSILNNSEKELFTKFNPEKYRGLIIGFYWNTNKYNQDGKCTCTVKCNGKGCGTGNGACKKITISIFKSGSVIITGGRLTTQIDDAYKLINNIFKKYYYDIVKLSILDFIDNNNKRDTKENIIKLKKSIKKSNIKKSNIISSDI
jgi:TATA-box binding protein (TBP) (component of TFIID and TFIIIB)